MLLIPEGSVSHGGCGRRAVWARVSVLDVHQELFHSWGAFVVTGQEIQEGQDGNSGRGSSSRVDVDVVVFVVMGFEATKLGIMIEATVVTVDVIVLGVLETGIVVMATAVVIVVKVVDGEDLQWPWECGPGGGLDRTTWVEDNKVREVDG